MRGRFLHNRVILAQVEERFRRLGASVFQEYPAKTGKRTRFVDLFVLLHGVRVVCEAELSFARIPNDVAKAIALDADLLLIVVSTSAACRKTQLQLKKTLTVLPGLTISILPLGVAIKRLKDQKSFLTLLNVQNWKTILHKRHHPTTPPPR